MVIETNESKGDKSLEVIQKAKSKLATRRTFLKAAGATGVVAAMYTVPKFSSVHAKPAYAGTTGGGVTIAKWFGSLFPETEFGGDGIIPDVAVTDITGLPGGISIRLGLAAHARYSAAPGVTGVAPGVYTASPGDAIPPPPGSTINGALWNFDYYIKIDGGTFADCKFCLLYDFDPSTTNSEASLGKIDFNAAIALPGAPYLASTTVVEGSENLLFGFLAGVPVYPFITTPSFSSFDATVPGEYRFELLAKTNADVEVGRTSIKVNVVAPAAP